MLFQVDSHELDCHCERKEDPAYWEDILDDTSEHLKI